MKNKLDEEMVMDLNRIAQQALNDGFQNWLKKHGLTGTAGECITSGDLKNAPGGVLLGKGKSVEFTDLPLHVRVAKALGKELVIHNDKPQIVQVEDFRELGLESHTYSAIPD